MFGNVRLKYVFFPSLFFLLLKVGTCGVEMHRENIVVKITVIQLVTLQLALFSLPVCVLI